MTPLRITFISRAHSPHAGGMERFNYELITQIKQQPNIEVKTCIYAGPRLLSPFFLIMGIIPTLKAARQSNLIHLGDPSLAFLGFLLKKFTGKPIAVSVHGLDISYPFPLYQLYLKLFFGQFDLYLPISQHVGRLLQPKIKNLKSKVEVISPGINDQYFSSVIRRPQLNQVLNRDINNNFIILTVGRLVKRKGHAWFIAHILPQLPHHVIYVIAGTGPESDILKQLAQKLNLESRVIFLGRASENNLQILYNTADAFVQPNIHIPNDHEGYGLVLVEAALCGLPVFASKMEGMKDAIHDGHNGTLLTPESEADWINSLKTLIKNKQSPEQSISIRDYTKQHHTWPHLIPSYLSSFTKASHK